MMETAEFEKKDSITVKRNAKGEYAWDIKIYLDNETQGSGAALDQINFIDNALKAEFL